MNPQYNSSACFACGLENLYGLRLRFWDNGQDQVFTRFTIQQAHEGYPGIVHGGIVATILDEVGGRTVMIGSPTCFYVTARMQVRYRRPAPVGEELTATGRLLVRRAGRTRAYAEILDAQHETLAEAVILYTDLPAGRLDPDKLEEEFGWKLYG